VWVGIAKFLQQGLAAGALANFLEGVNGGQSHNGFGVVDGFVDRQQLVGAADGAEHFHDSLAHFNVGIGAVFHQLRQGCGTVARAYGPRCMETNVAVVRDQRFDQGVNCLAGIGKSERSAAPWCRSTAASMIGSRGAAHAPC